MARQHRPGLDEHTPGLHTPPDFAGVEACGGIIDWQRNGTFLKEDGYYTNLSGDEAIELIDQRESKKPFFLYFASLAPHAPYQVPESYTSQYASVADKQRLSYSGMANDWNVAANLSLRGPSLARWILMQRRLLRLGAGPMHRDAQPGDGP